MTNAQLNITMAGEKEALEDQNRKLIAALEGIITVAINEKVAALWKTTGEVSYYYKMVANARVAVLEAKESVAA